MLAISFGNQQLDSCPICLQEECFEHLYYQEAGNVNNEEGTWFVYATTIEEALNGADMVGEGVRALPGCSIPIWKHSAYQIHETDCLHKQICLCGETVEQFPKDEQYAHECALATGRAELEFYSSPTQNGFVVTGVPIPHYALHLTTRFNVV